MSKCYIFTEEELTALANSIRTKAGIEDKMTMSEMCDAIRAIESATVAKYGVTDTYDFGDLTTTGTIAQYCKLFPKYVGYHITSITAYGLANSSVEEFDFPLLTSIGQYAFQNCSGLTEIEIKAAVTSIGGYAFYNCTNLEEVTFLNIMTSLPEYIFRGCNKLKHVILPSGLTSIAQQAFYGCGDLIMDELPENLTSIGGYAFYQCYDLALTELPDSITTIGQYAFYGCSNLELNELPASLNSIGGYVFQNCPKVTIHEMNNDNWTTLPNYIFYYATGITHFKLPSALTAIPQYSFSYCTSLVSVEIGDAVTTINSYAFDHCSALANIDFNDVTTINSYAFQYSGLKKLTIPSTITSISTYAFAYCTSLEELILEPTMTSMSNSNIFRGCTSLKKVYIKKSFSTLNSNTFYGDTAITDIYVPWASGAVSGAPWGATNATVHYETDFNQNLASISVADSEIDHRVGRTSQLTVSYSPDELLIDPTQLGVTYVIISGSEYATVDQNGLVTITSEMTVGDTITITVTSTYNSSITDTCTITATEPSFTVDLNNGQWVDSGETIAGRTVYKSDAGSYHVNNGLSRMTVTIRGYDEFRVAIRSYAESGCDYAEIGALDTVNISRNSSANVYKTDTQSASVYDEYTFTNIDGSTHTFEVIYSKDGSANSNDDRAYVYFNPETNILNGLILTGESLIFGTAGTTSQISLTYDPSYCDESVKGVTWSVTTNNASVDQNGLVTLTSALNAGDIITIRATSTYDNTIYAEYSISIIGGSNLVDIAVFADPNDITSSTSTKIDYDDNATYNPNTELASYGCTNTSLMTISDLTNDDAEVLFTSPSWRRPSPMPSSFTVSDVMNNWGLDIHGVMREMYTHGLSYPLDWSGYDYVMYTGNAHLANSNNPDTGENYCLVIGDDMGVDYLRLYTKSGTAQYGQDLFIVAIMQKPTT